MTTAAEHMAATLLRLAGAERDSGNELRAEIFEAAADLSGATCSACGAPLIGGVAEPPGPPVDGREVDRAPEEESDRLEVVLGRALRRRVDSHHPETGGGLVPSPEADPPPPHRWLGPAIRDCFCLIGGDHVAEPRFEKEN